MFIQLREKRELFEQLINLVETLFVDISEKKKLFFLTSHNAFTVTYSIFSKGLIV